MYHEGTMLHTALTICFLGLPVPADVAVLDRPVPERVSGPLFAKALDTKVSASWRNVELRTILNRLADAHKTSVLLDRGIDPTQELDLDIDYQTLGAAFAVVAKSAGAELSILGNTIYIGPAKRVAKLRTLENLRAQEPLANGSRLPAGRMSELSRTETVHWNDLDEPRRLIVERANQAGIEVANPEAVPHDLWATATLPKATITETLSLVLIQFDLTFAWNEDATQIRLVPIPEVVAVEKPYTPSGGPSARASREAKERFLENAARSYEQKLPGISCRVDADNNRILVSATLEQHDVLAGKDRALPTAHSPAEKVPPLSKRQFTLHMERKPASALMKTLEESGVIFKYDPAQLAAKNINLDDPISMDVKQADANEFFKAFCEPLGLKFSINNVTVTLTPK
jgi:hypothetical protein